MPKQEIITLSGLPGSPYTRKMLAALRYKRLTYSFISPAEAEARGLPKARVPLWPTFYLPGRDGAIEAVTDSSPLIRRLDNEYNERCIAPADPARAFIDMLLEDYGDEWLTKPLFHYRWAHEADIERGTDVLPLWFGLSRPDAEIESNGQAFAARQIGRLSVVGSSAKTAKAIEDSYARFLVCLNAHLTEHPFLLGARPGAGDFAAFGQLTQLAQFDPTPMALTFKLAPRVYAWSTWAEDLSGLEPQETDWLHLEAPPQTLRDLLCEVGRTYAPVMLANAHAVAAGEAQVDAEVDGQSWTQPSFPYQAKCVVWLRESYSALDSAARSQVDALLEGTGCEELIAGQGAAAV